MQEEPPATQATGTPQQDLATSDSHESSAARPALALVVALAAAFIASQLLADSDWLSPVPPATDADPNPTADVSDGRLVELYRSAFTAWAALLLFLPAAVSMFGGWGRSSRWRNWWSVSFVAFAVHMFWSMFVFFDGDIGRMTSTSRVAAFWPGIVLLVWWAVDVVAAWAQPSPSRWVEVQRYGVHALAFVLFVGGSAVTGETMLIRLIGGALFLVVAVSLARRFSSTRPFA